MGKGIKPGIRNSSVGITALDIIWSESWELINVLITASGWSKIKGKRIVSLEGGLNYASAWIKTEDLADEYLTKTGNDLLTFGSVQKEDYGASFGMGN